MTAGTADSKFIELRESIKKQIVRAFKAKKLKLEEVAAILFFLAFAENYIELQTFFDLLAPQYPVLASLQEDMKIDARINFENKIKAALHDLMLTDPMRAAVFSKAALKQGVTWEELAKDFPEINNK